MLLDKLKSALYEGKDILDDIEYQRLKKQVQDGKSDGSTMDSLKKNLRSAMPSCLLKDKVFACLHSWTSCHLPQVLPSFLF